MKAPHLKATTRSGLASCAFLSLTASLNPIQPATHIDSSQDDNAKSFEGRVKGSAVIDGWEISTDDCEISTTSASEISGIPLEMEEQFHSDKIELSTEFESWLPRSTRFYFNEDPRLVEDESDGNLGWLIPEEFTFVKKWESADGVHRAKFFFKGTEVIVSKFKLGQDEALAAEALGTLQFSDLLQKSPYFMKIDHVWLDYTSGTECADNVYFLQCGGQSRVYDDLCRPTAYTSDQIVKVMWTLLRGMAELHQVGLMYTDLAPTAIIRTENNFKIGDFKSIRRNISEKNTTKSTRPPYYLKAPLFITPGTRHAYHTIAPEVLTSPGVVTDLASKWSAGVILRDLLIRKYNEDVDAPAYTPIDRINYIISHLVDTIGPPTYSDLFSLGIFPTLNPKRCPLIQYPRKDLQDEALAAQMALAKSSIPVRTKEREEVLRSLGLDAKTRGDFYFQEWLLADVMLDLLQYNPLERPSWDSLLHKGAFSRLRSSASDLTKLSIPDKLLIEEKFESPEDLCRFVTQIVKNDPRFFECAAVNTNPQDSSRSP